MVSCVDIWNEYKAQTERTWSVSLGIKLRQVTLCSFGWKVLWLVSIIPPLPLFFPRVQEARDIVDNCLVVSTCSINMEGRKEKATT